MAVTMALGMWSFPAVLIYALLVDPGPQSLALEIAGFTMSALLILLLSSVAWPILHQAQDVTQVLKQNLPALIVNQKGIWDYSSSYMFGFIPWEDIEAVMVDGRYSPRVEKQRIGIGFVAKNKEVLLRRKPLTRFWLNAEPAIAFRRQIFIPQEWIDTPVRDLVKQIDDLRTK